MIRLEALEGDGAQHAVRHHQADHHQVAEHHRAQLPRVVQELRGVALSVASCLHIGLDYIRVSRDPFIRKTKFRSTAGHRSDQ